MKLKVNTKALIASTVALAVIPFTKATAETLEDWVARSVDEIKHDIQQSGENQQTYTIKYGDTLSSIAEALGIDVHVLANLNNISNMDLIYPGTVLKTTVNDQKEVTFNFIFYPLFSLFFAQDFLEQMNYYTILSQFKNKKRPFWLFNKTVFFL